MSNFKDITIDFYRQNKYLIFIYAVITTVFYILNFIFFRNAIDAPVDVIFITAYIVFTPGIFTLFTMYRSSVVLIDSTKTYYFGIVLHGLFTIIINIIVSFLYAIIRENFAYWVEHFYIVVLYAIPILLFAIILAFEVKLRFDNYQYKIVGLLLFIITWYGLNMSLNEFSTRHIMTAINLVYFYLIPLGFITLWYRRKLS